MPGCAQTSRLRFGRFLAQRHQPLRESRYAERRIGGLNALFASEKLPCVPYWRSWELIGLRKPEDGKSSNESMNR